MRSIVAFVLIDGLADVATTSLDNQTILQLASSTTASSFRRVAAAGVNGLLDPVECGYSCGSDTAHLSLFGYDPRRFYRGRGSFESMGAGLPMLAGDIAFKCNFASLAVNASGEKTVVSRRADRNFEREGPILCEYLAERGKLIDGFPGYEVSVKYATEHRCGVRIRGPKLCDRITGTDPLKDNRLLLTARPTDDSEEARITADVTNAVSLMFERLLGEHEINRERIEQGKLPANCVLLRGCGVRIDAPSFKELHGMKGFMVAPTAIIAGLGMSIDLDIVKAEGGTGDYHTNLDSKADVFVNTITDRKVGYDFGFLHIKAVDDAGHDKNWKMKLSFIERIDAMVGKICKKLHEDEDGDGDGDGDGEEERQYTIVITGDHTTPYYYGDHSCEPVPFTMARCKDVITVNNNIDEDTNKSDNKRRKLPWLNEKDRAFYALVAEDKCNNFTEIDARDGILGRFNGGEVMSIIKHFC